jgi:molybdate transport system substrate-binding protein
MDIFLAADFVSRRRLWRRGWRMGRSRYPTRLGTLVLWARKDSPLQPLTQNTLTDPR